MAAVGIVIITQNRDKETEILNLAEVCPDSSAPFNESKILKDPESGFEIIRDEILVHFKDNITKEDFLKTIESIDGEIIGGDPRVNLCVVEIPYSESLDLLNAAMKKLETDPSVEFASRDYMIGAA